MDFPYDLVSLGHFEAGGGWEAQIRQYVRKKYRQDLAGLAGIDPKALAGLFRGELVAGRPYATIQWVLRVAPFRPLELFLLFDQDPEFGTDVRVFYLPWRSPPRTPTSLPGIMWRCWPVMAGGSFPSRMPVPVRSGCLWRILPRRGRALCRTCPWEPGKRSWKR